MSRFLSLKATNNIAWGETLRPQIKIQSVAEGDEHLRKSFDAFGVGLFG